MKLHTVTGLMDAEDVGCTMIHEHLILNLTTVRGDQDSALSKDDVIDDMSLLKEHGCNLIVEVSNMGMGRQPLGLVELARRTDIAVIASTGFYKECHYPPHVFTSTAETLAEIFIRDIAEGMDGTAVRAGLIAEIGSSLNEVTAAEQTVFHAAALAHLATGAPISTHCEIGTMGREQLKLFDRFGVDPGRISFGHQDLNLDMEEQLELLESGAYIQFDTIGKQAYRPDADRTMNLAALLEKGYVEQLMLSCDITRKSHLTRNGGYGYIYLFRHFIPRLKELGVTDEMLHRMLTVNPRTFLSF
ncbi:phosphotriesterase-related protein [Paenibacillus sp. J5C_2022]|uniref:phosphotriesterase family protein n=1 Tax=Paenibacillus sp. J5C2022 TaxID=2977129 RepID=UPI0021D219E8|nr:phosphotriesterase-related protein [Paenibacillus sp. J5C2022]MCU6710541.1 phosphotriesterase-related protein [Paenibacillus sp. J5C2022]